MNRNIYYYRSEIIIVILYIIIHIRNFDKVYIYIYIHVWMCVYISFSNEVYAHVHSIHKNYIDYDLFPIILLVNYSSE
jgi:hypothetical protein